MPVKKKGKYNEKMLKLAVSCAEAGLTDIEIAKALKIACGTYYDWKIIHPEFGDAIQDARLPTLDNIEQSLYKEAIGYDYEETSVVAEGQEVKKVTKTKKHQRGDVTAAKYILMHRRPDRWGGDKSELTGDIEVTVELPWETNEGE